MENMKVFRTVLCVFTAILCGAAVWAQNYTWIGGSGNITDLTNWSPSLPSTTPINTLPTGTYTVNSGSPYLAATVSCEINVSLNIKSGAVLDLRGNGFSGNTPVINVSGKLKLYGTSTQKNLFLFSYIDLKSGCTVEYSEGSTDVVYEGPYENLIVRRSINTGSFLTVKGKTTIQHDAPVTITAPTQNYKGAVTLTADTNFTATSSLTFEQHASVVTNDNNTLKFTGNGNVTAQAGITAGTIDASGSSLFTVQNPVTAKNGLTVKNFVVQTSQVKVENGDIDIGGSTQIHTPTPVSQVKITAKRQTYHGALTISAADTYFNGEQSLTFENNAAIHAAHNTITLVSLSGTISTKAQITGGTVIVTTGTGTIEIKNRITAAVLHADVASGKLIIKGHIKLNDKFEQTGNGRVQIGAPITDNAAIPAELPGHKVFFNSKNIYFTDTATLDPSHITKPADCNIFIGTNLTLKNSLSCANFVLFNGTVTFAPSSGGITTSGDIALFGNGYIASDTESGVADLFTYHNSKRAGKTAASSLDWNSVFPAGKLPDGETLAPGFGGASYSGAFSDLSGKTLSVGKNFYANKMNLAASGAWTLAIPDNDNATSAFAEAYFTTVQNCTAGPGWVTAAEGCTGGGTNPNWDFNRPTIVQAYTVSDDTIYVKFSEPIENSNNEISKALANIKYHNGVLAFSEARMVKSDGTPDNTAAGSTDGKGDIDKFFLRTNGLRWNTDATGTFAGNGDSTDRGSWKGNQTPEHRTVTPNLNIPKALNDLYETLRDAHKNRIQHYNGSGKFTGVTDNCPPVLAAVYTGQEQHTQNPAAQADCDAHNFIEFRYSEPVFIGGSGTTEDIAHATVNQHVSSSLGEITNLGNSGLKIAGLATIAAGTLDASILFPAYQHFPQQPHALYRRFVISSAQPPATLPAPANQECRLRISIAGYTAGSVTVNGKTCKKWVGCIENAVTPPAGTQVTILALGGSDGGVSIRARNNQQELDRSVQRTVSTPAGSNYGPWDTSAPVCAKAANTQTDWTSSSAQKEITAYSSSSRFADKMEFHFFDNTPSYTTSEPWWKTPKIAKPAPGWSNNNNRYDSYGGSRLTGSNRTTGGIRACTLTDGTNVTVAQAFSFSADTSEFNTEVQKFSDTSVTVSQKTENEALYGPIPTSPAGFSDSDTLYLQFKLNHTGTFPVAETFKVKYNANATTGRITDLAGNRMKGFDFGDTGSINAAPPNIGLTVAPVGTNRMFVLFTSQLNTSADVLAKIPGNLEITGAGTLRVNETIPASVAADTQKGTGLIVFPNENVPYGALQNAQVKVKPDASHTISIEPKFGGFPSVAGHAHALSDFAVNVVHPLYAFDNKKLDDGTSGFITQGLYGTNSHAARLFDGSGAPGNTVLEKEDITLNVAIENAIGGAPPLTPTVGKLKLYMDNTPDEDSVAIEFNALTGLNSRIWLPTILPSISSKANSALRVFTKTLSASQCAFTLLNHPSNIAHTDFLGYPANSRAGFLFGLQDSGGSPITIDHDADSSTPNVPLYALRLKNPEDPSSIDLWSLDISAIKRQRGGVSILNNVINTNVRENTVIEVDMSRSGTLSITVISLDGNVVKILHSGYAEEGKHLYRWNGTNASGDSVARGMYFIRVAGPDIDETRKVMTVSD